MKEDSAYERGMLRVFLFYWDDRDGPEFKGWWFADRVGGVDVWGRSSCDSVLPPSSGWRCPWDLEAPNEVIFPRVGFFLNVIPCGTPWLNLRRWTDDIVSHGELCQQALICRTVGHCIS